MIPGSHRQTRYDGFDPQAVNEDPTKPYFGKDLPPLPDIEAEREKWNIVSFDITPGDVIFLHPAVIHGGGPTLTNGRRRALTIRLYGDDIVFGIKKRHISGKMVFGTFITKRYGGITGVLIFPFLTINT